MGKRAASDNKGGLLALPTVAELEDTLTVKKHQRHAAEAEVSKQFVIEKRTFDNQYAEIYSHRLKILRPVVAQAAERKWGKDKIPVCEKLLQIKDQQECVVIGTLYKHMPLIRRVLDDFKEKSIPVPPPQNYTSDKDSLVLEDESGRTTLVGGDHLGISSLVTGIVVAVRGTSTTGGEFEAKEILFPGVADVPEPPSSKGEDKYVAILSGANVGGIDNDTLSLQLAIDFLSGQLGTEEQQRMMSNLQRVIVAGNSLSKLEDSTEFAAIQTNGKVSLRQQRHIVTPLRELDGLFTQLSSSVEVDVMPGSGDPSNYTYPQQALNGCLLPMSTSNKSLNLSTNPYSCVINGVHFLGTSGQNVENIQRYVAGDDAMDIAKNTLMWRHLAPTAPDQLACYPFHSNDPFVMTSSPNVYFIGNADKFETTTVEDGRGGKVTVVMVPSFTKEKKIVLVNCNTMEVTTMSFQSSYKGLN
ncbi:DNA-directed DNA polymerase delta 2-like [Planoprotostelium fungivorum]|uniref:DNA-directed DNA polymerase delta 2-like n=1 Tax=Planoprotostelium fungivorum TaxID=1890364 RepID=A0A2P6N6T5_9EUKA|nr:DNA-directed DNA polymerase delta 2-like [Planoprotostelium fungivorum]